MKYCVIETSRPTLHEAHHLLLLLENVYYVYVILLMDIGLVKRHWFAVRQLPEAEVTMTVVRHTQGPRGGKSLE